MRTPTMPLFGPEGRPALWGVHSKRRPIPHRPDRLASSWCAQPCCKALRGYSTGRISDICKRALVCAPVCTDHVPQDSQSPLT